MTVIQRLALACSGRYDSMLSEDDPSASNSFFPCFAHLLLDFISSSTMASAEMTGVRYDEAASCTARENPSTFAIVWM